MGSGYLKINVLPDVSHFQDFTYHFLVISSTVSGTCSCQRHFHYVPESAGAMLIGFVVTLILHYSGVNLEQFAFNPAIFFFGFLPPIILEAGYSMDTRPFYRNIGTISVYLSAPFLSSSFHAC